MVFVGIASVPISRIADHVLWTSLFTIGVLVYVAGMKKIPADISSELDVPGLNEAAWIDVIRKMDETYSGLIDYQMELEQKNATLETMRWFMDSVLQSMTDILVVCDKSGNIAQLSRSASGMAATGDPVGKLFSEDSRAQLKAMIERVSHGFEVEPAELMLRTAFGDSPVEVHASPRLDARGRHLGPVLIGRPVGELRRAYQDLNMAHEKLKAAQTQLVNAEKMASLGRLVSGVAHELNNPISFVYANAHALERYVGRMETYFQAVNAGATREELIAMRADLKLDVAVSRLRSATAGALEGAERVRDIVESLRQFSAPGRAVEVEFDLAAAVQTAVGWIAKGRSPDLRVAWDVEQPITIRGRVGHIQQVVMNIVQNAADALEDQENRQIDIHIGCAADEAILRVSDNGPGLSDEARDRVFEPFFTTKPAGKGTGLGLSISYQIVKDHGGRLQAYNRAGGGAVFEMRLPINGNADVQA